MKNTQQQFRKTKNNSSLAQRWNNEYLNGDWEYLDDNSEFARYALIASYCEKLKPHGAILDAGCGEGLLYTHLKSSPLYHGIDISSTAIDIARKNYGNHFSCEDINQFRSHNKFDVLVLNEVLYYLNPDRVLTQLRHALNTDALVIISIFQLDDDIQGMSCEQRESSLLKIISKYLHIDLVSTINMQSDIHKCNQNDDSIKKWKIYFSTLKSSVCEVADDNETINSSR